MQSLNYERNYKGYLAAKEKLEICQKERFKKAVEDYYKSPNKCLHCNKIIELKTGRKLQSVKNRKFCSHRCAGKHNSSEKRIKVENCLCCGSTLGRHKYKFCSIACHKNYNYKEYIDRWKKGEVDGGRGAGQLSQYIRRYIIEKYNNRCSKCGWSEINIYSNIVPLEVNHINGDSDDHKEENLELLCLNCHGLTPTYRGLNRGKGRKDRILKYHVDKFKALIKDN